MFFCATHKSLLDGAFFMPINIKRKVFIISGSLSVLIQAWGTHANSQPEDRGRKISPRVGIFLSDSHRKSRLWRTGSIQPGPLKDILTIDVSAAKGSGHSNSSYVRMCSNNLTLQSKTFYRLL